MLDTSWRWLLIDRLANGDTVDFVIQCPRSGNEPVRCAFESLTEFHRKDLLQIPRFEISNAASYLSDEIVPFNKIPSITIPFVHFWMEFRLPDKIKLLRAERRGRDEHSETIGVECFFDANRMALSLRDYTLLDNRRIIGGRDSWFVAYIGQDGKLDRICITDGKREELSGLFFEGKEEEIGEDISIGAPLFALALMNCKNISQEIIAPTRQVRRQMERDGVTHCTYKVLMIEGKGKGSTVASENKNNQAKSLHICRGHIKTFDGNGLFGKLKGTYWWSDHVRGDYENGVVVKDYEVAAVAS